MSDNHPPYGGYPDPNAGSWSNQPDPNAPYGGQPASGAPYGGQSDPTAPFGSQPASGAPYGSQPASGAPYGSQPASGVPYGSQPASGAPYGQPDPTAPYGTQPAVSYPGQAGYPGQSTPYSPNPPEGGKKKKGLIIGLVAGGVTLTLLCCGGGAAYFALNQDEDEPTPPAASASASPEASASPSESPSESPEPGGSSDNNNALTARYSSEMSAVCDGGSILNAAPYTGPTGAKALVFSNSPAQPSSWSQKIISSSKPYYTRSADFATASVIGCLTMVPGSEGAPKKCRYKASDGKAVTIDYISSRYTLAFHAAKTGEKVGDGGTVTAPAAQCPSVITYNKVTLKSYASPDAGSLEAALDRFLR
ncbi:hypothetical protein [Micromonospora sp. DT31]|uniref:hypothetical protein n=1 Tax=Micromonospora sp. DT31 TaxID=3393434 RepID=UPI003CEA58E5